MPGNGANAEDSRITCPATSGEGCGVEPVTRTESPVMRRAMARSRFNDPIEPMTLSNMRENGVRSLAFPCHQCRHEVICGIDTPARRNIPELEWLRPELCRSHYVGAKKRKCPKQDTCIGGGDNSRHRHRDSEIHTPLRVHGPSLGAVK
jgi:hypothetical protein